MVQQKEFMLIFRYDPSNGQADEDVSHDLHQKWGSFIGNMALQEKLVSTHQLGNHGMLVTSDLQTTEGMYGADSQTLGGYMIIRAASILEATELAKNCPILLMGGSVEARDIVSMN
jgi:hypothetical protein